MCTIKRTSDLSINFVATNVILSIQGQFTFEQAYEEIQDYLPAVSEKMLFNIIKRLRENDYLEEMGHSYSVIPKEKSVRWGLN